MYKLHNAYFISISGTKNSQKRVKKSMIKEEYTGYT